LSTADNPITIFTDESYTFNAANSSDYNNQSQLNYHWQIVSNPDNIKSGITSPVSTDYNFTIPANIYKDSENAKMALVVKSNVKPYLTNSIIRNLNIINVVPVLVLNPSSNFTAEANNNVQIINSSYVEYPQNTSSNFVIFSATATPSSGVISQPTITTQLNNSGIIFSPYRYVPNTTNTVNININVKNATYPTKEVSKIITMSLSLRLTEKFNGSLSYGIPNYRVDTWSYWDKSRDSTFGITTNISEKNSALSNIIPRISDLTYKWSAMMNNNLITGTIFNNDKSASVTTGTSWPTVNNSYEFICDISYGLFSIPITLRTPPIKYIETILIGSSSSSYIDYNVYTSMNKQGESFIQYTEYRDPITRKTVGIRFNTDFEFTQMVYLASGDIWKTMRITQFSGASFSYSESSTLKTYTISKTNILEITKNLNNNPNTLQLRYFESAIGSIYSPTYYIYSSDGSLDITPINCVVSDWGPCSVSTPSCAGGIQRKTILQNPNEAGTPCPPESELTRNCNIDIRLCTGNEV
jgi:hypothetical protein